MGATENLERLGGRGHGTHFGWRAVRTTAGPKSAAKLYVVNCPLSGMQRGIDMPDRAIPETPCGWIVLFTCRVGAYLSQ